MATERQLMSESLRLPAQEESPATDYKAMMANLAQSLMPGGDIEKSYIKEAEQEGRQLAAQLNAASISKGLGNVTNNAPVTAAKHVAKRKQEIRGNMLQQLLSTMQFLSQMSFQESEAQKSREMQHLLNRPASKASRGLDTFGQPMSSGFSAASFPSLASAGGMDGGAAMEAPSWFGGSSGTVSDPVKFDYSLLPNNTATLSGGGRIEYF